MKEVIKGEKISLEFSKEFYNRYKRDVCMNLGRKVSKEEVIISMMNDLLIFGEDIKDYVE